MPDAVLLLLAMAACYLGFACLALSQCRPWQRVAGSGQGPRLPLRLGGYSSVGAGLVLTVLCDGPAFGVLLWGLLLSAAAMMVALTLAWRPAWLAGLAQGLKRWQGS